MAPAIVGDGGPLTSNGITDGTQRATFQLPLLGKLLVESVVAQVDGNAAASRPILSVLDKSGAVIAKKRQGETIPAGDTGSATWALRLADDGGAGGAVAVTDGVTTVDPTAEVDVGLGLVLSNPAAGVAEIATRRPPFATATSGAIVVPAMGGLLVDYSAGGADRELGDADGYFSALVGLAQAAFRVIPTFGGVYVLSLKVNFRVDGAAGTLKIGVTWPPNALCPPGSGGQFKVAFAPFEDISYVITTMLLLQALPEPVGTDVYVVLSQDSAVNSRLNSTDCSVACYRLSPSL